MSSESSQPQPLDGLIRVFAWSMVATSLMFLFNNYLIFWQQWPGFLNFLGDRQWLGISAPQQPLAQGAAMLGWLQTASYVGPVIGACIYVYLQRARSMRAESHSMTALAAYIVRGAFWAVLLIGLADIVISFLRIEDYLEPLVGKQLTSDLGRPVYRGTHVHYPLIALGFVMALFIRGLGFIWLAFLVVLAEFQIVISRFVFSYEQAFMGDLVRFWYAALFLFASAYALINEGHVRVDVFYAQFSKKRKAWVNLFGSLLLGLPVCWVILTTGMWGKGNSINSPMLSFEISQSGYGLFVKYLMSGFLVVYALSMIVQFCSYILDSVADLRGETSGREMPVDEHQVGGE